MSLQIGLRGRTARTWTGRFVRTFILRIVRSQECSTSELRHLFATGRALEVFRYLQILARFSTLYLILRYVQRIGLFLLRL